MGFFFKILSVKRSEDGVCDESAAWTWTCRVVGLVILQNAMRREGVGDGAGEFEGDGERGAVRCHQGGVHLHFLLRVAISDVNIHCERLIEGLEECRILP